MCVDGKAQRLPEPRKTSTSKLTLLYEGNFDFSTLLIDENQTASEFVRNSKMRNSNMCPNLGLERIEGITAFS